MSRDISAAHCGICYVMFKERFAEIESEGMAGGWNVFGK